MKYINQVVILVFLSTSLWLQIENVTAIVGGKEAIIGQFKYQVSLQVDNEHICGGVIITEQHVLSAAHCVIDESNDKFRNENYMVIVGIIDVSDKNSHRIEIEVEKLYVPAEFKMVNDDPNDEISRDSGDIIVFKLKKNLLSYSFALWSKVILPQIITQPTKSNNYPDYEKFNAIISGFGAYKVANRKNDNGITVTTIYEEHKALKFGTTEIISNRACAALVTAMIYSKHICARMDQNDTNIPEGACSGDSGSPLVLPDNTLVGILSGIVPNCNEQHHPAIYTRVTSFLPFISKAINDVKSNDIRVAAYTYETKLFGKSIKILKEIKRK